METSSSEIDYGASPVLPPRKKARRQLEVVSPKDGSWPSEDVQELFQRIRKALKIDTCGQAVTCVPTLNWNEISFKHYTPNECKKLWLQVLLPIQPHQLSNQAELLGHQPFKRAILKQKMKNYESNIIRENQLLYPHEPPKPPENVVTFYGLTFSNYPMDGEKIRRSWTKLNRTRKDYFIKLFKEIQTKYIKSFEHFVRSLSKEELLKFRSFMIEREKNQGGNSVQSSQF